MDTRACMHSHSTSSISFDTAITPLFAVTDPVSMAQWRQVACQCAYTPTSICIRASGRMHSLPSEDNAAAALNTTEQHSSMQRVSKQPQKLLVSCGMR